jgi:citrate lyase beta subunit
MLDSYFFIPGDNPNFLKKIGKINADYFVIDLEDAVRFSEREIILEKLVSNQSYRNLYIRVPLYNKKQELDTCFFINLYKERFRKFIFPKIQSATDFDRIISGYDFQELQVILLVESARFLLEAKDVLTKYINIFSGIGLGSHDFMAEIGGIHDLKNLEYARQHILYLARMSKINAIDIASMELHNRSSLEQEILDGVHKGYDAKFFIHPWQIDVFKTLTLYSMQDYNWAVMVLKAFEKAGSAEEFNPVVIEGQVVERPHLNKAKKIIQYYESK